MRRYRENYRSERHERSKEQLQDDLVAAFDKIGSLETRLWVVTSALGACGGVIAWLATQLMNCLGPAHQVASKLVH